MSMKAASKKPEIVVVERHHYVLDWYEIEKVQIDLSGHVYFELDYRQGDWYLTKYALINGEWKWVTWDRDGCFRVHHIAHAIAALGGKVRKLQSSNSHGPHFLKELTKALSWAQEIIEKCDGAQRAGGK